MDQSGKSSPGVAAYEIQPQLAVHHTGSGRLDLKQPTPQGRRVKDCFVAFLVLEGELFLRDELPGGPDDFYVREGDIHVLGPGIAQYSLRPSVPGTRMLWTHFSFFGDPEVRHLPSLEAAASSLYDASAKPPAWFLPRHLSLQGDLAAITAIHADLREYVRAHGILNMGSHHICGHLIAALHAAFTQRLLRTEDASPRRANVARACHYIRMNYHKKISLAQVAKSLNLSSGYLSRSFQAVMGQGLVDYLLQTRIQAAKEMLAERATPSVKEVAYLTGFSSPIYFCRVFRKLERQTALQYAARMQRGEKK